MPSPDGSVWVLHWIHPGKPQTLGREDVAAILPAMTPIDEVATIAEVLHAERAYTLGEKLALATGEWLQDPYPASVDREKELVMCGHAPYIEALLCRPRVVGSEAEETLVCDQFDSPTHTHCKGGSK